VTVFVYDRNRTCSHCGEHCFEERVISLKPEPYRCAFCLTLLRKFRARVATRAKKA